MLHLRDLLLHRAAGQGTLKTIQLKQGQIVHMQERSYCQQKREQTKKTDKQLKIQKETCRESLQYT